MRNSKEQYQCLGTNKYWYYWIKERKQNKSIKSPGFTLNYRVCLISWCIVAVPCCLRFYCTEEHISYSHTRVPSFLGFLSIQVTTEHSAESPVLCWVPVRYLLYMQYQLCLRVNCGASDTTSQCPVFFKLWHASTYMFLKLFISSFPWWTDTHLYLFCKFEL